MVGQGRRRGVAGESYDRSAMREYTKPVYEKSEETQKRIREVIKLNDKMQVLFGHLNDAGLQDIINAFKETDYLAGTDLIRQGEEGDCLYIISDGTVDVFVKRASDPLGADAKGSKVVTLGRGALFGELALMYSAPRAATVTVASGSCKLWQLDREPFKMLLAAHASAQYEMYEGWLSEVEILRVLNHYELSRLSELLQPDWFDPDEVIVEQGAPGDKFFILEEGACAAFMKGPSGEAEIQVKEYSRKGEFFGELALLSDDPRKATVRATESCTVLTLSKEDFIAVLGPIQDLMKEKAKEYSSYEAAKRQLGKR